MIFPHARKPARMGKKEIIKKKGSDKMKHMRKLFAVLLAVMLVMGLATTAFAATVSNTTSGHSYEAYQVFKGTQANGSATLGDIDWGTGVNKNALLNQLKADYNYFDSCESAADVAKVLENKSDNCAEAQALANVAAKNLTTTKTSIAANATSVELAAGYWLLVDTTTGDDDNNANTAFGKNAALLQVTNDGDIVIGVKYGTPEVEKTVNDADVNIGDTVTFTLTATLPNTFEGYDTYKIVFHDTMSKGLAFKEISSVKVDGTTLSVEDNQYTKSTAAGDNDATVLTVTIENIQNYATDSDLSKLKGKTVVVTYTATVDSDAVIGTDGNPNKVYLEYSNDPNWDGKGTEPTGDTPEKEVKVYTWEIPVFKYTGDNKTALAGAKFSLYTDSDCTKTVNLVAADSNTTTANVYKVCTKTGCTDHTHVTSITTNDSGKFEIEGLEQGTYYLKETKAPDGYNQLKDAVTVEIGKNGALTQNGTSATQVEIENNQGSTLPETGGIGTTIFYVLGGVLVLAAVVLLVTKKRMSTAE